MPKNWKTYKLGEVSTLQRGFDLPNRKRVHGDYPVIAASGFSTWHNEYKVKGPGVTTGRSGTLGQVFYEVNNFWPLNTSLWVKDFHGNDPKFIYYFLKTLNFQEYNTGTSVPTLNRNDVHNLDVQIPDLPEQKAIANILSAIDDKIENNLAINKTLEDMAMALYKHWFVDFGPFQDGEFIDSELGPIPKGWEVKRLDNLIDKLSKGTTPRMKDIGDLECTIPFLKVKDLNSDGEIDLTGLSFIPESIHSNQLKRSILVKDDLLFSIAGTIGRVSIVPFNLDNSNCNQALAFIRLIDKAKYNTFVYNWLKSKEVQEKIFSSIVQGVQANVSLTVLKELQLVMPIDEVITNFSIKMNPIHNSILENQLENQSLTQLRDTLLPKLISGEVRLKEFKEQIESVIVSKERTTQKKTSLRT